MTTLNYNSSEEHLDQLSMNFGKNNIFIKRNNDKFNPILIHNKNKKI